MSIVDPAICNAIKIFETVLGMCPKSSLQCVGGSTAVAHITHVIVVTIIEPVDRVLSTFALVFINDFCNL